MKIILDVDSPVAAEKLGAKAAALSALERAGLPVPPWFVVSSDAFAASVDDAGRIAKRRLRIEPSEEVRAGIARAVSKLVEDDDRLAVRSSMPGEDGRTRSFAGQFESHLGVRREDVAERVADVWRSAFAEHVTHYRNARGVAPQTAHPVVLVQRMIEADASGIAFSADPVSGQRGVTVIAAVHGLGCALANGGCEGDEYRIDRAGRILSRSIARKDTAYRVANAAGAGVEGYALGADTAAAAVLDDVRIRAVAELARLCQRHFGMPQDIEWAIEGDALYLLQSRPITSLAGKADPDGALAVWDNSNIAESYSGVTTPLTFSYVRNAYTHVYRELCRIGGVPERIIVANERALHSMVGLVRGRIHYNLLSWYRLLALTPGFQHNRGLLDDMLGLRHEVTAEALEQLDASANGSRLRRWSSMARVIASATINHFRIRSIIEHFDRRVDAALAPGPIALEDMRADELVQAWYALDGQLTKRWDAPLVNDYLAMFFHGALGRLVERWFPESDRGLANALLQGEHAVISVEPARRLRQMAELVRSRPRWVDLLRLAPRHAIEREMKHFPELEREYRDYLATFGDRCLDELKLESPTLDDDPSTVLRAIGKLAHAAPHRPACDDARHRTAKRRVHEQLRARPMRRLLFAWILRHARARVRDRENLRFQRTRVFGRVRRLFVELGRRLHAMNVIDAPPDVFYLEVEEIIGFVEATTTCTDLRGLAATRKAEFDLYRHQEAPDDRFETRGVVHHGHDYLGTAERRALGGADHDTLRIGQPGASGRVRGRVRVVTEPRTARLGPNEILVAERTDPGWIVLFSGAAGLVIERGSALSHTAIVARELGIPTVIGIDGACRWLRDGDWVEIDGDRGAVVRLGPDGSEDAA